MPDSNSHLWLPIIRSWALTRGFALQPGTRNRYEIRCTRTQHRSASRQVNDHDRVSGTHTAISAFLKGANEFEDDEVLSAYLIAAARSAGAASLTTALAAPSPAAGLINVRWHPRPHLRLGVDSFASPPDTLFLAGWGWIPMYEETGDGRYLEACQAAVNAVRDLTLRYEVIQQDWLGDSQRWKPYIVDEAGFGMEGLAEYFRITGDSEVRTIGRRYIDQILAKFERPDGLWDRF